MTSPKISKIADQHPDVQVALLDLNNRHAEETSHLSADDWQSLIDTAFSATCINDAALLIAFDHRAPYDNPNFNWFSARYERFIYVDRIIVSAALRGAGAARTLYTELFGLAGKAGCERVVCEVNSDPPNPGSDAFHAKMGFEVVGQATLSDRQKTVRYLARAL